MSKIADSDKKRVYFLKREFKGSRLRCLMMTAGSRVQSVDSLQRMIRPHGIIEPDRDTWMPKGFLEPAEALLGRTTQLLTTLEKETLLNWWLKNRTSARTPNWDIVSTFQSSHKGKGLLLVEAKAHHSELSIKDKCGSENDLNLNQIESAILESSSALSSLLPGWNLVRDGHYQLCNRFAWSWKLATMGYDVILVYLGFLHAHEMGDIFISHKDWVNAIKRYSDGLVPFEVWGNRIDIGDGSILPLIISSDYQWQFGQTQPNHLG